MCKLRLASYLLPGLLIGLLSSCSDSTEPKPQTKSLRPVRSIEVKKPDLNRVHEFTAVVDASRKADLSFKVPGELVEFLVKPGDRVAQGQLLARLKDKDFKVQLEEARSNHDKALADFERGKNLIATSHISRADFDKLKASFDSAAAKLESAENNLNYTQLHASFDGVIAKKYTENFQEVNAKTPVLALHDLANINLKVDIPETVMIHVQRNAQKPQVVAIFDAIDQIEFPLTFKEVSTQADEVTKTYQVTFSMPSPQEHMILPGMSARVRTEKLLPGILVAEYYLPAQSVLKDAKGHYVFLVSRVGDAVGQIERRSVTIGDLTPLGIEVFSGVSEGEHVITAGMSKMVDGMQVKF